MIASGAFARNGDPAKPAAIPTIVPVATPVTTPTFAPGQPAVTPTPRPPADGVFAIDLKDPTGHDVRLEVTDKTGDLVDVRSGQPGDGMSVRWGKVEVENVDADTLRVVWVGLPRDETITFALSSKAGKVQLVIAEAAPPPYSDAMGADRMAYLEFSGPIRAEDVEASLR